ncbi:MAG: PorV/PorQ family protein [Balneolaceae bacterium]|nr:PorV/PorQ family protein [Balneolaceae bacterium]
MTKQHLFLSVFATLLYGLGALILPLNAEGQISFVRNVSNKGTVAAPFLELGVNARAEAMGGAYVAQYGNVDMMYWNPAGLMGVDGIGLSFSNIEWLAETSFQYAAATVPLYSINSMLGVSFTTLGVPQQEVRDYDGSLTGERYDARDFALGLTFATALTEKISVGGSAKYIHQRIWSEKAIGLALDFGIHYQTPVEGLSMGTSLSNFGGNMSMEGKNLKEIIDPDPINQGVNDIPVSYETMDYPLPQLFRFGLAYQKEFGEIQTITAVDVMHPTASTESINLGTELGFKNLLFLRAGYQNLFERGQVNGLTLGAGVLARIQSKQHIQFDYAWSDWGRLGRAHRVSMSIQL